MAEDIEQGPYPSTIDEPSARLCNFATGSSKLLPTHKSWISSNIIPLLQNDNRITIQIAGIASRRGSEGFNQRLGQDRAQAVADYIEDCFGKSIANPMDIGSYGESLSAGKKNDNDGFYRAVALSASVYGFEPPVDRPNKGGSCIGELKKLDEQAMQKMRKQQLDSTWLGAGVKGGGMAVVIGADDAAGVLIRASDGRSSRAFNILSFRGGFGLGVSGGPVAVLMFNTPNPYVHDRTWSGDWGLNIALGSNWSKYAKLLTQYGFFAKLGVAATKGWGAVTPKDWEDLRNSLHVLNNARSAAEATSPAMICFDIPVGSVGLELSLHASYGFVSVF